jgi:hypothetical protein
MELLVQGYSGSGESGTFVVGKRSFPDLFSVYKRRTLRTGTETNRSMLLCLVAFVPTGPTISPLGCQKTAAARDMALARRLYRASHIRVSSVGINTNMQLHSRVGASH